MPEHLRPASWNDLTNAQAALVQDRLVAAYRRSVKAAVAVVVRPVTVAVDPRAFVDATLADGVRTKARDVAAEHLRARPKLRQRFRANLGKAEAWRAALGIVVPLRRWPELDTKLHVLREIEALLASSPLLEKPSTFAGRPLSLIHI